MGIIGFSKWGYEMEYGDYLKTLTTGERRYLSKYDCGLCGQKLSRAGCSAIHSQCTDTQKISRATECLKQYAPRGRK